VSNVSDIDTTSSGLVDTVEWGGSCDDDALLLAAHLAGDPDAFGVLLAAHRPRMLAVARRRMSRSDEAIDIVQEAALKAFKGAAGFRGEASVATWLHRIVINTCLDRLKTAKPTSVPYEVAFRFQADPEDPHDSITAAEARLTLEQALRQLPPQQRIVLELVHLEGLSLIEVADRLSCPVGTVKSRCSRGRAALADHLAGTWPN
jgi:RNA polymerase sigma-70 factor, ECF subfamily